MNVSRLVASVGGYFYSTGKDTVAVHLYGSSQAHLSVAGVPVTIRQEADYPWSGKIALTIDPETPVELTLKLRIPGWARSETLAVNGTPVDTGKRSLGYVEIRRQWSRGDRIDLDLPMPVERVYSHPKVRDDIGRVALKRGPLVYCVEEADNPTFPINRFRLPRAAALQAAPRSDLFDGIVCVAAEAKAVDEEDWNSGLYRAMPPTEERAEMTALPYYLWSNRGPGRMMVWIPEA
jgi:DUF1680 family protein